MKFEMNIVLIVIGLSLSWRAHSSKTCEEEIVNASTKETVSIGMDGTWTEAIPLRNVTPAKKETHFLGHRDFPFQVHIVPSTARLPKNPILCFIPGGPGLSSNTLRELEILKRSHDLAFFDPPETGGQGAVPWENYPTRDIYEYYLASFLYAVESLRRDVILIGHSFGGLLSADAAVLAASVGTTNIRGIVPIAAPLREEYFVNFRNLIRHSSESSKRFRGAHDAYYHHPTPETFANWVASLEPLIVSVGKEKRLEIILEADQPSANTLFFLRKQWPDARSNIYNFLPRSLASIRNKIRSHFIVPAEDKFFPPDEQLIDARTAGGSARYIKGGSHFVFLERPSLVANTIENFSEKIYTTPNHN